MSDSAEVVDMLDPSALNALEDQALQLCAAGNCTAATALLDGTAYTDAKATRERGMDALLEEVQSQADEDRAIFSSLSYAFNAVAGVLILAVIIPELYLVNRKPPPIVTTPASPMASRPVSP